MRTCTCPPPTFGLIISYCHSFFHTHSECLDKGPYILTATGKLHARQLALIVFLEGGEGFREEGGVVGGEGFDVCFELRESVREPLSR